MKTKLHGFLTLFIALLVQISFAQERIVSGVVTDNNGLPIPGVNVLVKGTKAGTQTDMDGKYTIKAAPEQTLVFNFVGMRTQEIKATSATVNVKMKDDAVELEGVVVTALGIKREKKSLGYATQELKGEDLKSNTAGGNFLNDLSGKVAGVEIRRNNNFGGSTNILSRGIKSLTGNNQMLIVIDGVVINNSNTNSLAQTTGRGATYDYGSTATDINPEDIESVNVLKGAASSALYGYQAGNGVLMITTKKGRGGKKGMGVTVSSEAIVGSIDKSTFPTYQNKYGEGYGLYYGPNGDSYFNEGDINGDGITDYIVPTTEDASYGAPFDNSMVYQWNAFTPYSSHFGQKTPWKAASNGPSSFFETPVSLNNTISIQDGNDKSNFLIDISNLKQNGLMPNSELKKNNFSAKFTHQFSDKLTATVYAAYTSQTTVGRNSTGYDNNIMTNFRQWWPVNVDLNELKDVYFASGGQNVTWNINSPTDLHPAYWDNPYFQRYQNYENDGRERFNANIKLDYKINDWLSSTVRISDDTYSEFQEERKAIGSIPSEFGVPDADNQRLTQGSGYSRYNKTYRENNYDLLFNFKKDFGKFNLSGLVGGTINRINTSTLMASTSGGLIVPGIYSLSNSQNPNPDPLEGEFKSEINSYYGSASLGYKELLYLDATVRRDAFSTLPKGNNAITYPSVSSSFVFSNLIKQNWLSFGKLRANWAQVGNGAPGLSLADTYSKFTSFNGNGLFSVNSTKNNANLKPVNTTSFEVGLETLFINKRIGLDIAYYSSLSENQIFKVPLSPSTGYSFQWLNAGSVRNKGVELQFTATPVKTKDFQWDVIVNWARNRNEVVSLAPGIDNLQIGSLQGGVTINAQVGQPYGVIKGSDFTYLDGQRVVGANGRYVIDSNTNNTIGNINPDWTGGIRNKFTYKDFSFSFLIDTQKGGDIFSLDMYYGLATGLYPETAGNNELGNPIRNSIANGGGVILPGVQADGSPNTVRTPSPEYYGNISGYRRQPSSAFIYDASYIKLREVSISYNLPKKWVGKLAMESMKFSIVGTNLWIIQKNLPYADPESGLGSGNLTSGYSVGSLPTTRNIGCNLTFKF